MSQGAARFFLADDIETCLTVPAVWRVEPQSISHKATTRLLGRWLNIGSNSPAATALERAEELIG